MELKMTALIMSTTDMRKYKVGFYGRKSWQRIIGE